jgi:F-type H+-transporting ATPase subunit delta
MDAGMISTRYAHAIYEYAVEKKTEMAVYKEIRLLLKHFSEHPTLRKAMNDPTVSSERKIKLLITASGIHINDTLKQVVQMVVENGRAKSMENIALSYDKVYREAKGIVSVNLTTVEPANEQIKQALVEIISKGNDEQVEFNATTDPEIIGGFVLQIGDKRLDASVKDQLNQLRLNLSE